MPANYYSCTVLYDDTAVLHVDQNVSNAYIQHVDLVSLVSNNTVQSLGMLDLYETFHESGVFIFRLT